MDLFKSEIGKLITDETYDCPCCNLFFHNSKKKVNRKARASLKAKTKKLIKSELIYEN